MYITSTKKTQESTFYRFQKNIYQLNEGNVTEKNINQEQGQEQINDTQKQVPTSTDS